MDKTIEAEFFKAYELFGIVDICIELLNAYAVDCIDEGECDDWITISRAKVFKGIKEFNFDVIIGQHSSLIEEINSNLKECTTSKEREKYLFSLLKPFKRIGDIFTPIAALKRIDNKMKETLCHADGDIQENKNELIKKYEDEKQQILHTQGMFINMINQAATSRDYNSIEYCLCKFWLARNKFANMLDALLLENGIDLMKLQEESGIYLKSDRDIEEIARYVGSVELTQKYIDELPEVDMIDQQAQRGDSLNEFNGDTRKIKQAKGRPRSTFRDKILHTNKDRILKELHELISGRKGREVALIIRVCIKEGIITKPTFKQVENEFGYIGNVSGYNKYMADKYEFNNEEINGIKKRLM